MGYCSHTELHSLAVLSLAVLSYLHYFILEVDTDDLNNMKLIKDMNSLTFCKATISRFYLRSPQEVDLGQL